MGKISRQVRVELNEDPRWQDGECFVILRTQSYIEQMEDAREKRKFLRNIDKAERSLVRANAKLNLLRDDDDGYSILAKKIEQEEERVDDLNKAHVQSYFNKIKSRFVKGMIVDGKEKREMSTTDIDEFDSVIISKLALAINGTVKKK